MIATAICSEFETVESTGLQVSAVVVAMSMRVTAVSVLISVSSLHDLSDLCVSAVNNRFDALTAEAQRTPRWRREFQTRTQAYRLLIINVGTMPPPELTLASSFEDKRVKADPTLPLNSSGSRSTSCSAKLILPSGVSAGNTSR